MRFRFAALALIAVAPFAGCGPEPPPVYGRVPPFTLTSEGGAPFRGSDLEGSPYVVSFIFTRCPSICPNITRFMKKVQSEFETRGVRGARLVSISVDPEYDTPERLRAYGAEYGAKPEIWTFLTGDPATVRALAVEGFKVPVDEPETPAAGAPVDIAHTGKVILVDRTGAIRGYFDTDDAGLSDILRLASRL